MSVSFGGTMFLSVIYFFGAIGLTILIELGVAKLLGYQDALLNRLIIWLNVLTNPILNLVLLIAGLFFGFESYAGQMRWVLLLVLELIVIAVEYQVLAQVFEIKYTKRALLKLSVIMNVISFGMGALLTLLN
jgi:hypothetical protein